MGPVECPRHTKRIVFLLVILSFSKWGQDIYKFTYHEVYVWCMSIYVYNICMSVSFVAITLLVAVDTDGLKEGCSRKHVMRQPVTDCNARKQIWFSWNCLFGVSLQLPSWKLTYPSQNARLKMIFLFPGWDMLVPWRVILPYSMTSPVGCPPEKRWFLTGVSFSRGWCSGSMLNFRGVFISSKSMKSPTWGYSGVPSGLREGSWWWCCTACIVE